jgi:hypothetical protein
MVWENIARRTQENPHGNDIEGFAETLRYNSGFLSRISLLTLLGRA